MNNHLLKMSYLILVLSVSSNSYSMDPRDLLPGVEAFTNLASGFIEKEEDRENNRNKKIFEYQQMLNLCDEIGGQKDYQSFTRTNNGIIDSSTGEVYTREQIQRDYDNAVKEAEALRKRKDEVNSVLQPAMLGVVNALGDATQSSLRGQEENRKAEQERKTLVDTTAVKAHVEGQAKIAIHDRWLNFLSDRKKVMVIPLAIGTAALGIYGAREGTKVLGHYLETILGKPKLVRESSVDTYWQQAKDRVFGKKPVINTIDEVIVQNTTGKKLQTMAVVTKNAKTLNEPLMNALFYGPPGVGKTMYAKELAKFSDMEYAVMSGADFSQFKEGDDITELHKLFDWAAQSTKGLIVFIDEADSFLRKRSSENKRATNLTNAFLSRVEKQTSNNIMFIFATNHPEVLDSAILSRIAPGNRIEFFLPGAQEREQIFNLYLKKYAATKNIALDPALDECKQQLAMSMEGLSGRDIDGMVIQMARNARLAGNNVITLDIVQEIITTTLDEKKKESGSYKQKQ